MPLQKHSIVSLVGQLIMPRLEVDRFDEERDYAENIERLVRESLAGGFCVFGGNAERVANTVGRLQSLAIDSPLLFSCDCEFGLPMRLTTGGTEFPDAMAIANAGEPYFARSVGQAIAREMRSIGLTWNFAPVVDVNSNPRNPIINTRSFGDNPETVALFAREFMHGLQSEGVAATAKHFPGHGDTSIDSHRELPFIEKPWNEFSTIELAPFESLIRSGVDSIMTGHLAIPLLAEELGAPPEEQHLPATLSKSLTTHLLRERLGFEGVIVTDALEMHAITKHFGPEEAVVRALTAGADVLLMPVDPRSTHSTIQSAVNSGILSAQRILRSVERIRHMMQRMEIVPSNSATLEIYSEAHSRLAAEIAQQAIELKGMFDISDANFLIVADDRPAVLEKVKFFADSMEHFSRHVEIITTNERELHSFEYDQNTIIAAFYRARGYVSEAVARHSLPTLVHEIAASLEGRGLRARGLMLFGSPYLDEEFQTPPGFILKTFSESLPSIRAVLQRMNDGRITRVINAIEVKK